MTQFRFLRGRAQPARTRWLLLAVCLLAIGQNKARAAGPILQWVTPPGAPGSSTVEVRDLTSAQLRALRDGHRTLAQWQQLLAVRVDQDDLNLKAEIGLPPMAGEYRVGTKTLTFRPAYPLLPGLRYRAAFYSQQLPHADKDARLALTLVLSVPAGKTNASTVVAQIYPTTSVVPENLLKFYLHFSAPMSRGHIYDHIHLYNESGQAVELPFLEIDEELWDPDLKRLTLFIDPGRIKRGVQPLEELGPSLENGRRYTLKVDPAWHDGQGNPLRIGFEKRFSVGPPDRTPPDPAQWLVQAPAPGTREPLSITFTDPMDHALALRLIQVMRGTGKSARQVEGTCALAREEQQWNLTPTEPWHRGTHELVVRSTIEDLAGNNIGKPFEVDLFEGVQRRLSNAVVRIAFEVR